MDVNTVPAHASLSPISAFLPPIPCPSPPGEPLPEELYSRIKAAKNYRSGTMMLRQLHFSCVDLELHARFKPGGCQAGPLYVTFSHAPELTPLDHTG